MKTKSYVFYLLLMLCFTLNTAMIQSNTAVADTHQKNTSQLKKKKSKFRFFKNIKKKIKSAVDGATMIWAILGIAVGALAIYYFFTVSFFVGIIAIVVVTFALYQLFRYFQY